jgi:hypothetical protein
MTSEADHLSLEMMQRLCEGVLPDVEQCFAEDHLLECDECRGVFQRMDALLYRGFSAEAHAAAIRREAFDSDPLMVALRRGAELERNMAGVLQRWLDSAPVPWGEGRVPWFGGLGAVPVSGASETEAIRVTLEAGAERGRVRIVESSRAVQVEVSGGAKPQAALLFDPESDSPPVVAEFQTAANGIHTAHFDDIPSGEYFIAVSPF